MARDLKPFFPLFFAAFLLTIFLGTISWLTLPSVLFDEAIYYRAIANDPTTIPTGGYLYSFIYSLLPADIPFYGYAVAKMLNLAFWLVQGVGLFFIARLYLGKLSSGWIALGVSAFSQSAWVHVLMPEIPFTAAVVWSIYFLLRAFAIDNTHKSFISLALSALVLGVASGFKVHALFLLPSYALILVFFALRRSVPWLGWLALMAGFPFAVVGTKLLTGYLIAGERGLVLLGSYQATVDNLIERFFFPANQTEAKVGLDNLESNSFPLPYGGFYLGVDAPGIQSLDTSTANVPQLFFDQVFVFLPVVVIAFAWLTLLPFVFRTDSSDSAPLSPFNSFGLISTIGLNLFALAIAFNVVATLSGDDHSDRALFRYVEFIFLVAAVVGASIIFQGRARETEDIVFKVRHLVPIALALLVTFGLQARIDANYADSAFIPLLGQPFVWLPLVILTLSTLYFLPYLKSFSKKLVASLIITPYAIVGIGTNLDVLNVAGPWSLAGSERAQAIIQRDLNLQEVLLVSESSPIAARIGLLANQKDFNYAVNLGTHPVAADDFREYKQVFSHESLFLDLDARIQILEASSSHLLLGLGEDAPRLRDQVEIEGISDLTEFETYSNGAVYSADGIVNLELPESWDPGEDLELCFLLPQDIRDRRIQITVADSSALIPLDQDSHSVPQCAIVGSAGGKSINTIKIESRVLENELESSATVISTSAFGLSRARILASD